MKNVFCKIVALLAIICLMTTTLAVSAAENQTLADRLGLVDEAVSDSIGDLPYYSVVKESYTTYPAGVKADATFLSSKGKEPTEYSKGGLYTDENTESVTYEVEVPVAGAYALQVKYLTPSGTTTAPQRELHINGKQVFYEQRMLQFTRRWVDAADPVINTLGDEVRPQQKEIEEFQTTLIKDQWGKTSDPLCFEFNKGKNTITFSYISQPLVISELSVVSKTDILSYAEVSSKYNSTEATDEIKFEAEDRDFVNWRSDATVSIANNGDPLVTPFKATNVRLNIMGGYSFRTGSQEISWKFNVPKEGLYKIDLRALQNFNDGLPVYRTIKINGEIPFAEMKCYEIPFDKNWNDHVISDPEGNPYLFKFKEGENTISLTVTLGPVAKVVEALLDASDDLSDIIFDLTMIIGQNPDVNYDYDFESEMPDLVPRLKALRDDVYAARKLLLDASSKNSAMANNLQRIAIELDELIDDTDTIALRMSDISNNLTNLSSYATSIQEMPMAIDKIAILPPSAKVENKHSNFWQRLVVTLQNFIVSFSKNYNAISSGNSDEYQGEPLEIWVCRGKEWGQILKEMIDADFTDKYKIPVSVNILPSNSVNTSINPLLLAIGSGRAPDVALGLPYNMPVEYAIREALVDLSKQPDYEKVSKRFLEEMLVPYKFEGGVYALPETMSFRAMYIRTDIFSSLNIAVPQTWDDVYNKLLPALNQNNMQMYIPQILDLFLYQVDGEYYTEDGLKSALDTPEAFDSFTEFCKLFTDNALPVSTDFFSRFRTGEMPIGIENHNAYLQFSYAAPEIAGNWDVYPVPGHVRADGTIDRTNSGLSIDAAAILSNCEDLDAAWKFIDWWTSSETQTSYTTQVEGRLGSQARWMSANLDAYQSLPWSISQKKAIQSSWDWAKETPVVRGGYYTNRHLVNAINRAIVENQSPRTALEEAVEQINKELVRKQKIK